MMFILEHIMAVEHFQFFLLICFCISFHLDSEGVVGSFEPLLLLKNKILVLKIAFQKE